NTGESSREETTTSSSPRKESITSFIRENLKKARKRSCSGLRVCCADCRNVISQKNGPWHCLPGTVFNMLLNDYDFFRQSCVFQYFPVSGSFGFGSAKLYRTGVSPGIGECLFPNSFGGKLCAFNSNPFYKVIGGKGFLSNLFYI